MKTDVHINLYQETGYSQQRYNAAAIHLLRPLSPLNKPSSFALVPYVQTTYNRIRTMFVERKIISFLGPVKSNLQLKTPGCVQSSPVSICQVCTGQTDRSTETCVTNRSGTSKSQSPTHRRWSNTNWTITTHTLLWHQIRILDRLVRLGVVISSPQQYQQGRWPVFKRVMETFR